MDYWQFVLVAADLYYLSLVFGEFRRLDPFYLLYLLFDHFFIIINSKWIVITHKSIISIVDNFILVYIQRLFLFESPS
jgi:hypothetical protein